MGVSSTRGGRGGRGTDVFDCDETNAGGHHLGDSLAAAFFRDGFDGVGHQIDGETQSAQGQYRVAYAVFGGHPKHHKMARSQGSNDRVEVRITGDGIIRLLNFYNKLSGPFARRSERTCLVGNHNLLGELSLGNAALTRCPYDTMREPLGEAG